MLHWAFTFIAVNHLNDLNLQGVCTDYSTFFLTIHCKQDVVYVWLPHFK